jgi:1-acyl-sn-glycerol-3-phosphate acyltransferase
VPILPVAIEGPFDSLPRAAVAPRIVAMQVEIGEPVRPEEFGQFSERELGAEVERRVRECHRLARERRTKRLNPWRVIGRATTVG